MESVFFIEWSDDFAIGAGFIGIVDGFCKFRVVEDISVTDVDDIVIDKGL